MPPTGKGRKEILIVAEAPGRLEDEKGVQLVGNSGRELESALRSVGVRMREDCVLDNSVRCRPVDNVIENAKVVEFCRPNVLKTIHDHQPKVIILLGAKAIASVVGHVWSEGNRGGLKRWAGWNIPLRRWNCWVCPTFHPAYLLREDDAVLNRIFRQHLKQAVSHEDRPWEEAPPEDEVDLVFDPDEAAEKIRAITTRNSGMVAFDFETNMLRPYSDHAEIVSCSLSDGETTFAFPWSRGVVKPFREFVRNPVPKIASNLQMEEKWTRRFVGCSVRGWTEGHDTMLDAHALTPRGKENERSGGGVTGLKFQAFVRLGVEDYSGHIAPYLETDPKDPHGRNRIRQVPMEDVLRYNSLDSKYEYEVARIQMEIGRGEQTPRRPAARPEG
jgi:DNA polymerase